MVIIIAFQAKDEGSIPSRRSNLKKKVYCGVEESGRPRRSHKPEIGGSNPPSRTHFRY